VNDTDRKVLRAVAKLRKFSRSSVLLAVKEEDVKLVAE
jgi:hypothetical protein